jgi:hypothetical protein
MSEVYNNSIRLLSLFSQLKQEMVVVLYLKKQSNLLDNLMNINTAKTFERIVFILKPKVKFDLY